MDEKCDEGGRMPLATLAEVMAQFGIMLVGKKMTLDLLSEFSRSVTSFKE